VGDLGLKRFVESLVAGNKKVAAICGGAGLLAGLGVLKGKKCTGLSSGGCAGGVVVDIVFIH
jgi:putative intracellular protease/amidase